MSSKSPSLHRRLTHVFVYASLLILNIGTASAAVTWHEIQFGGFLSQGYLVNTGHNDYLGNSSEGTFDFREYAANLSYSHGRWRIGGQAFGQKLGRYGDDQIKLDWATVDYQVAQWFGLRAGRVKLPRGLYNEALDLDSVRPFVLLPQSVYDNRLRDFSAAFDGGMAYGNVSLHRGGSLDYRAFYGRMPLSLTSGASDYFNTDAPFPNTAINIGSAWGGTLFWNTPLDGLRVGYSFSRFKDFRTLRYVPFRNASAYKDAAAYDRHLLSLEYTTGDWVLAAEAGQEAPDYDIYYVGKAPYAFLHAKANYRYLAVSRRINPRLELGAYYSYSDFKQPGVGTPVQIPLTRQEDYALSARFDVNDHLLFKVEVHHMKGAEKIFDLPSYPQPRTARDQSWDMLAVKTTYSF